jgi:predicted  nucleic acid-binding Zn-ribbon protein
VQSLITFVQRIKMNSTIQHTLQSIETAVKALQNKLLAARLEKDDLLSEIKTLKHQNENLSAEVIDLKKEEANLLESLEASKQLVETAAENPNVDKDAQIDELVREIEYCIEQLTK